MPINRVFLLVALTLALLSVSGCGDSLSPAWNEPRFYPQAAFPGQLVTVSYPSLKRISFGGIEAEIVANVPASWDTVVRVPEGATTGRIVVEDVEDVKYQLPWEFDTRPGEGHVRIAAAPELLPLTGDLVSLSDDGALVAAGWLGGDNIELYDIAKAATRYTVPVHDPNELAALKIMQPAGLLGFILNDYSKFDFPRGYVKTYLLGWPQEVFGVQLHPSGPVQLWGDAKGTRLHVAFTETSNLNVPNHARYSRTDLVYGLTLNTWDGGADTRNKAMTPGADMLSYFAAYEAGEGEYRLMEYDFGRSEGNQRLILAGEPLSMTPSPDGRSLWLLDADGSLKRIELAGWIVTDTGVVDSDAKLVLASPDSTRLYLAGDNGIAELVLAEGHISTGGRALTGVVIRTAALNAGGDRLLAGCADGRVLLLR